MNPISSIESVADRRDGANGGGRGGSFVTDGATHRVSRWRIGGSFGHVSIDQPATLLDESGLCELNDIAPPRCIALSLPEAEAPV